MPIYEFYCKPCHTVYKFFSRTINTEKIPRCPKCGYDKMERRVSLFATINLSKNSAESEDELPPIDESKMEKVIAGLAREADKINEDDPRQAAQLMRKLSEATGLKMNPRIEEALSRLERGEDPEKIEEDMGDFMEEEEPFILEGKGTKGTHKTRPNVDETLYDL